MESKIFDLEDRTFEFARRIRRFIKSQKKTICNLDDCRQLIKASGSVGANYIEANESLSKKDFLMRIKISRKEAKESAYWLRLLEPDNPDADREWNDLLQESRELMNIFGAIVRKSEK
jgi:four helix bundle protein